MHWTEDCICNRQMRDSKTIEFFRISASRTELRASDVKILWVGGMNPPEQKRFMPLKRSWSYDECLAMRYSAYRNMLCLSIDSRQKSIGA